MEKKYNEIDISTTNMALFGTDVEKNLRYKNAENEPEWQKIPKDPCLLIWRIENFCVVPWPKEDYGSFFQGDSYIVLNVIKEENGALDYNAYMWVGKETSKDEAGTAAYKIVELDDFFHGAVDLFYEAQGGETEEFLALFKELIIMEGGCPSGFKKVKVEEYKPRLIKVEGNSKAVRSYEVPMKFSSLTEEDGFVIDAGLDLFSWRGESASPFVRFNCASITKKLQNSRNGKPKIKDFDEGDKGTFALMEKYLENDMKGEKPKVKLRAKPKRNLVKNMLKISDESGKISLTKVTFSEDSLQTNDAFLIDNGKVIIIWVGKGASPEERKHGLEYAKQYAQDMGKKIDTGIILVKEGSKNFKPEKVFA